MNVLNEWLKEKWVNGWVYKWVGGWVSEWEGE